MHGLMARARRDDLWLPILIGLVCSLASLILWGLLVVDRRERILASTAETAEGIGGAIELGLAQQFQSLEGLAELWADFGLRSPVEWTAQADLQVDRNTGLAWVAWVDLDTPASRIAGGTGHPPSGLRLDREAARESAERARLVGPSRDDSGETHYQILLPVHAPEEGRGVLVADVRPKVFLENLLEGRGLGYAVEVLWNGAPIFDRGEPSSDPWQEWWRVEVAIALPLEKEWRVVYRPTAELAASRLTATPHYLLAASLLLSLLLAVVGHQLRLTVRQARFLAASNRALERRGAELESRVAERTASLEDAVNELEAFNYSVSHDLRSPLGAILNLTAILEEDYRGRELDDEAVQLLSRIRRSASRGTELLRDLLELSRAGRAALAFESIDMTALARETFAQARAAEGAREGDVEFVVGSLPPVVGDRTLLAEVFDNLFSNALKYSRGGEKRRVEVSGWLEEEECIYQVSDNGQGFDMRFVDKVFRLFERLHSTEVIEGTGVGLTMVARIVRRHGGRVSAEGWPGEGARFTFALPRRSAP
jgi:signal transduction histidine kinase